MTDSTQTSTCTQCRVTSPWNAAFQQIGYGKKLRTLCPYCVREEHRRVFHRQLIHLGFLVLLVTFVALVTTVNIGWLLLNFILLIVMAWMTILPHEAGHALAARLMGFAVDRIVVGFGRKLTTVTLFGVPIEIHMYPTSGATHIAIRDVPYARWKWALIVLAGPLANLLLLWLAVSAGSALWLSESIEHGPAPVSAFIAANLLILIGNLWPSYVASDTGKTPTDGAQLLALATGKPYDFAEAERNRNLMRLQWLFEQQRWNDVETHAARYLEASPDDYPIQVTLSAALINLGRLDEARELLERLMARSPPHEWHRAVAANNLAWLLLLSDDPALAERARSLAASAYEFMPWEPFIISSYACTHALFGDAQLATSLLTSERVRRNMNKTLASSLAGLSIAYARLDRHQEAEATLQLARTIDREGQLVSIAERRLSTK